MTQNLLELGFSQNIINKMTSDQINVLFQYYNENEIVNMNPREVLQGLSVFCQLVGVNKDSLSDASISSSGRTPHEKELTASELPQGKGSDTDSVKSFIEPLGYKEKVWALMLIKNKLNNEPNLDTLIAEYTEKLKSHVETIKILFAEIKAGKPLKDVLNNPKFSYIKNEMLEILKALKLLADKNEIEKKLIFEIRKQPSSDIESFYLKILNALANNVSKDLASHIQTMRSRWAKKEEPEVQKQLKEKIASAF